MRRQIAALIAVLGLVVSACTSSAAADEDLANLTARPRISSEEAQAARMIENFFGALRQRDAYALYALFQQDDQCRPALIEDLLAAVELGIAETSEVEVDDLELRQVGATQSVSFTLIEHQGASERELAYATFFPIEETVRPRFAANLCEWLASPGGDAAIQAELRLALDALQAFFAEHGTYLASGNDLRYFTSGLSATMDQTTLAPGEVLVVPGDLQALLVGQGVTGVWYCIAVGTEGGPVFGSGDVVDDVILFESCLAGAVAGW
mgnify:CR=1 FL=1